MEQEIYAHASLEGSRYERHSEQLSESLHVKVVASFLKLVVHVEGTHHSQVHIDELSGEIQVPLYVACVYDIYHDIRSLVYYLASYVHLLRRVSGEGVCAGKVHQVELIPLETEFSHLGIDGDTAVVAHALMSSRCKVKQCRLATVGVAYESHVYSPALSHGGIAQLLVRQCRHARVVVVNGDTAVHGERCRLHLPCLFNGYYFYHLRLLMAQ